MPVQDITGQTFNRLTVIERNEAINSRHSHWLCKCVCGNIKTVRADRLKNGKAKSCGCLKTELLKANPKIKHGHTTNRKRSTEYTAWQGMKRRCYNPDHRAYPWYGGKGIKVYEGWLNSFEDFLDHIGLKPSSEYTLDRIDGSKDYMPGNVRWATWSEQRNNRAET